MVKRTAKFYGPIVELSRLQSELNRLFAAFVETNNRGGAAASSWDPNVDVLDDGETIRILVELPGVADTARAMIPLLAGILAWALK
jgi:HSP20 family molecular chaperone IbpA